MSLEDVGESLEDVVESAEKSRNQEMLKSCSFLFP